MKKKTQIRFLITAIVLFLAAGIVWGTGGMISVGRADNDYVFEKTEIFRLAEDALTEDHSDEKYCETPFVSEDGEYICTERYTPEEFEALTGGETLTGYIYTSPDGKTLVFSHEPTEKELSKAARDLITGENSKLFGAAMACFLVAVGLAVMLKWNGFFSTYEKVWFIGILVLAAIFSLLFPEEEVNGVNGLVIMALYLADTFLNILCELLISKQSKWNFIVSVFVELTEIAICVVLAYRFATLASTLFFWLPCDIVSFINWHKHPDRTEEELTEVRTLKGWQELLIVLGIVLWTVGVGFLLTTLDFGTELFGGNRTLEVIVCFLDACASAVGVVNGVFILLRLREQWIAWYICAVLEGVINVLSGQYVLLILKLGYLTNTTYGYIRWTKYINAAETKHENKE